MGWDYLGSLEVRNSRTFLLDARSENTLDMPVNGLVMERHRKHREGRVKKNRDGLKHVGGGVDRVRAWIGRNATDVISCHHASRASSRYFRGLLCCRIGP